MWRETVGHLVSQFDTLYVNSQKELKETMKPSVSWCSSQHPIRNKTVTRSFLDYPEDGGRKILRNVDKELPFNRSFISKYFNLESIKST